MAWERVGASYNSFGDAGVAVETSNVTAFTLEMGPGGCPFDLARKPMVTVDGQKIEASQPNSDRSWSAAWCGESA